MPLISVTRLRLRSAWQLPRFFWLTIPAMMQAKRAQGNLAADALNDANLAFWTRSVWKDEASMRTFMMGGAHRKAMPALLDMCDEASVVHWEQEAATLPPWPEGHRRMLENGRSSKVRNPSAAHQARDIPAPRA